MHGSILYAGNFNIVIPCDVYLCLYSSALFETLPGHVQCEMLLKATEQCFNTLEKAEMLLLLLKRFPESVVQHGVCMSDILL